MANPGWLIARWQKQRLQNAKPYKKMKDRDMTGVVVYFKRQDLRSNFSFTDIEQPGDKITPTYIANLAGRKGMSRSKPYGLYGCLYVGYDQYLELNEDEFYKMCREVNRLGGSVALETTDSNTGIKSTEWVQPDMFEETYKDGLDEIEVE